MRDRGGASDPPAAREVTHGARFLAPLFARPAAWRVLDCLIGIVMGLLALGLLISFQRGA